MAMVNSGLKVLNLISLSITIIIQNPDLLSLQISHFEHKACLILAILKKKTVTPDLTNYSHSLEVTSEL